MKKLTMIAESGLTAELAEGIVQWFRYQPSTFC